MGSADAAVVEADLLDVAVEAARAAAAELLARWRRPLEIGTKSTPTDPVTGADVAAERAIRDVLARRRPQDSILGEEGGQTPGAAPPTPSSLTEHENANQTHSHSAQDSNTLRWVVDPLDGTVNYMYGLPTFAVSVAVEDADGALAGVVLDPVARRALHGDTVGRAAPQRRADHGVELRHRSGARWSRPASGTRRASARLRPRSRRA